MRLSSLLAARPSVRFEFALRIASLVAWSLAFCRCAGAEVQRGFVMAVHDVRVPSMTNGVVFQIRASLGEHVEKGDALLDLDDAQSSLEQVIVSAEHDAAIHRAGSDVGVRFAAAGRRVADMDYRRALTANQSSPNTVSEADLEKLRLTAEESLLKVEAAGKEHESKAMEVRVFAAKRRLSTLVAERSRVSSPVEGEIAEVLVQEGEWVEPGRPLVRIVGLETIRIESLVSTKSYRPADLYDVTVTVRARLSENTEESFEGQIKFISPMVRPGGDYLIAVEVPNRKDRGHWILRPGMEVEFQLTTPGSKIGPMRK